MAPKGSLAERAKYQFEADSEDEAMEEEIDANIDLLHGAAGSKCKESPILFVKC